MKPRPSQEDQDIFNLLEELKSVHADYPTELLARRRAAFLEELGRLEKPSAEDSRLLDEEAIIGVLEGLRHVRVNYPPLLLVKRRAIFIDQLEKHRKSDWMEIITSTIQNGFVSIKAATQSMTSDFYRSFILVSLLTAVFAGIMIFGKDSRFTAFSGTHLAERDISQPIQVIPTGSAGIKKTTCAPDSASAPCLAHGFTESLDQTSWVSRTANSWIKIDIGRIAGINKVELDRNYSDGSTGDFTISVAQSDGQYQEVYDSESDNLAQPVVGMETVQISFEPVLARYVKVTIDDPGIVISEVRAFSVNIPPTLNQRDEDTDGLSLQTMNASSTPVPTDTRWPTDTPVPTSTPAPTDTPMATDTQWPTNTPVPTSTPAPTETPMPTDTQWPTDTPVPTSTPAPTDTPVPTDTRWPTDTPVLNSTPMPSNTPDTD